MIETTTTEELAVIDAWMYDEIEDVHEDRTWIVHVHLSDDRVRKVYLFGDLSLHWVRMTDDDGAIVGDPIECQVSVDAAIERFGDKITREHEETRDE